MFVVVHNDRHTEPQVELFTELDAAIEYIESHPCVRDATEVTRTRVPTVRGDEGPLLYYVCYSIEGDAFWVTQKTPNPSITWAG